MTKTIPNYSSYMPDFAPMVSFWTNQAEIATYISTRVMKTAMAPWQSLAETLQLSAAPKFTLLPSPAAPEKAEGAGEVIDAVATEVAPVEPVAETAEPMVEAAEDKAADSLAVDVAEVSVDEAAEVTTEVEAEAPVVAAAEAAEEAKAEAKPEAATPAEEASFQPAGLDAPRDGAADNLRGIKGVGPKLEEALNALGIFHFDQIASWSPEEVSWADDNVPGARGRVSRDGWVAQAAALASAKQ